MFVTTGVQTLRVQTGSIASLVHLWKHLQVNNKHTGLLKELNVLLKLLFPFIRGNVSTEIDIVVIIAAFSSEQVALIIFQRS